MRLADDDPPALAAALADVSADVLHRLLAEDAGFNELVSACRALRDLPDEAWLERMRRLVRERRIADEIEASSRGRPRRAEGEAGTGPRRLVLVASNSWPSMPDRDGA